MTSYRINYVPERYNENLEKPTRLTLYGNEQVTKEFLQFQKKNRIN